MALKLVIFLGLIAIALGAVVDPRKPIIGAIKLSTPEPPVEVEWIDPRPLPIRKIRSPDGGSANVNINHDDKSGTTGTISGKENVWSSSDGKTNVNVGGSASTNFDNGHSNVNVGVGVDW